MLYKYLPGKYPKDLLKMSEDDFYKYIEKLPGNLYDNIEMSQFAALIVANPYTLLAVFDKFVSIENNVDKYNIVIKILTECFNVNFKVLKKYNFTDDSYKERLNAALKLLREENIEHDIHLSILEEFIKYTNIKGYKPQNIELVNSNEFNIFIGMASLGFDLSDKNLNEFYTTKNSSDAYRLKSCGNKNDDIYFEEDFSEDDWPEFLDEYKM